MNQYPLTLIILGANVLISLIGFSNRLFLDKFIGWPYYEKNFKQYYRLLTSGFLHADFMHLFFNMFTFYFFGRNVEGIFKSYELGAEVSFVVLYISSLIIANLPSYFKYASNKGYRALGASGAVSGVVFSAILFNPWGKVYLYGAIGIPAIIYAVLYVVYCIYSSKKSTDNISHDAHLWGAVWGTVFTLILVAILQPQYLEPMWQQLTHPKF